jgi:hypothetical protein
LNVNSPVEFAASSMLCSTARPVLGLVSEGYDQKFKCVALACKPLGERPAKHQHLRRTVTPVMASASLKQAQAEKVLLLGITGITGR